MKTHISLNVRDVQTSVEFYQKVFGVAPQKQAGGYAKFDLNAPDLNFSLLSSPTDISRVNHFGIEVESADQLLEWEERLQQYGLVDRIEQETDCCFARQNKVWFTDPDRNHWEVFTILEQLPVNEPLPETGCCTTATVSTSQTGCSCP